MTGPHRILPPGAPTTPPTASVGVSKTPALTTSTTPPNAVPRLDHSTRITDGTLWDAPKSPSAGHTATPNQGNLLLRAGFKPVAQSNGSLFFQLENALVEEVLADASPRLWRSFNPRISMERVQGIARGAPSDANIPNLYLLSREGADLVVTHTSAGGSLETTTRLSRWDQWRHRLFAHPLLKLFSEKPIAEQLRQAGFEALGPEAYQATLDGLQILAVTDNGRLSGIFLPRPIRDRRFWDADTQVVGWNLERPHPDLPPIVRLVAENARVKFQIHAQSGDLSGFEFKIEPSPAELGIPTMELIQDSEGFVIGGKNPTDTLRR